MAKIIQEGLDSFGVPLSEESLTPSSDWVAFLYSEPDADVPDYAQCSSCTFWIPESKRCRVHGPEIEVLGSMTCGLYANGKPDSSQPAVAAITAAQSGLVDRPVRCENCKFFQPEESRCGLYASLNEKLPNEFKLEEKVKAQGCCNANTAKDQA